MEPSVDNKARVATAAFCVSPHMRQHSLRLWRCHNRGKSNGTSVETIGRPRPLNGVSGSDSKHFIVCTVVLGDRGRAALALPPISDSNQNR